LRASRSANARPVASSAKMYISTHTRRRARSIAWYAPGATRRPCTVGSWCRRRA
jgi:hypothetical protein